MFGLIPFALGLGLGATLTRPRYYPSMYPYAYAPYPYAYAPYPYPYAPYPNVWY